MRICSFISRNIGEPRTMSSSSLQSEINSLTLQHSRLLTEKNRHEEKSSRATQAYSQKIDQANRASSGNSVKSYLRSAEMEQKKVVSENGKIAALQSKIATLEKRISDKRKSHQSTLKRENERSEQLRKAEQRKVDQETKKRRNEEIAHAREIARVSRPEVRHVAINPPKPEKLRILYLTSNPDFKNLLRTDAEVNSVLKVLRASKYRDLVDLQVRPAATPQDLLDGINDVRPHVVHFSGHGNEGLLLFDNASLDRPEHIIVEFDTLGEILAATSSPPKLLVMNACSTLHGADVLLGAVPVLIAMQDSVGDAAAGVFATQFYSAIASGQPIGYALAQAKASLKVSLMLEDAELPKIKNRAGIDPNELALVTDRGVYIGENGRS